MTKKDLKAGMIVILRNGGIGIIDDKVTKILSDKVGAYFLCYYNDNLTRDDRSPEGDVVAIYDKIWTGNDGVAVTMKDIEVKFGYKIKIIG